MTHKVARALLTLLGLALGPGIVVLVDEIIKSFNCLPMTVVLQLWAIILIYVISGLITGIIIFILSPKIICAFSNMIRRTETMLSEMPLIDVAVSVGGLAIGLLIAFLLSTLVSQIPFSWLSIPISALLYVVMGYLGWRVALRRRGEIIAPSWTKRAAKAGKDDAKGAARVRPKVLDTSVIIDGRISDICTTGIVEGDLVVPGFVLQELRHIADSADALKRNRGRRGLDILNRMQKELGLPIKIVEQDYDDISEVDSKLLRLASDLGGVVVTNDYNLNKVASVSNVPVFNINDLANAIKPVVLPGEEMRVTIVRDGKEQGQGVAYLDDGTMIVVDGGKRFIGSEIDVAVTSVLQTSAGRMIFAKQK